MAHSELARDDHRIHYIELRVADVARAKAFFAAAFDWTFIDYGPGYAEFSDGRMTGGLDATQPWPEGTAAGGPLVVLYADDLEAAAARVTAAGGAITTLRFAFPGGERFHFRDPDGYEWAVWRVA